MGAASAWQWSWRSRLRSVSRYGVSDAATARKDLRRRRGSRTRRPPPSSARGPSAWSSTRPRRAAASSRRPSGSALRCTAAASSPASSSTRSLEEIADVSDRVGLTLVQLHGDEGPAFCSEVARRTGARTIKAAAVRGPATLQDLERFHTDFHLLDGYAAGLRGGTGEPFDWSLYRAATLEDAADPERRPRRRQRRRSDRGDAALRRRRRERRRALAWHQGPRADARVHRGRRRSARMSTIGGAERRPAPLRPLRRPVRARDADAGARGARGGVARRLVRRGVPRRAGAPRARLRRPPDAAV